MVVVSKEGAGKSSLTFGVYDCESGDRVYPTISRAKLYKRIEHEGTEHAVILHFTDSPGL